jgi:hypothetical protein
LNALRPLPYEDVETHSFVLAMRNMTLQEGAAIRRTWPETADLVDKFSPAWIVFDQGVYTAYSHYVFTTRYKEVDLAKFKAHSKESR